MLVLTRKLMEKLYIGDAICVTVVRLEGGQVRLGIEAPREIAVVRAELLEQRRGGAAAPHVAAAAKAEATPIVPMPGPVTTRPVEARGIDIRRRGQSR
jgi:carbon storage regulator